MINHTGTEVTGDVLSKPLNELSQKALANIAKKDLQSQGYTLDSKLDRIYTRLDEWAKTGAWEKLADTWPEFIANWVRVKPEIGKLLMDLKDVLERGAAAVAAGGHGGDRKSDEFKGNQGDNVTLKERGNDKTYTVRRLMRDRPDLAEKVLAGELSANAAAIQAGFRQRTVSIKLNPESAAQTITKHFSNEDIKELIGRLNMAVEALSA